MASLVMSGGGAGGSGMKGGGGASGNGDVDIGSDGVVVGAEGTYPVEIGFMSGKDGEGSGRGAGGEAEADGGEAPEEVAQETSLGSWAADFGLFVSEDGKEVEGAGDLEIDALAGWGVFEAGLPMETKREKKRRVGGGGGRAGPGQAAVVGADATAATGAEAVKVATEGNRQVSAQDAVGSGPPVGDGPRPATEAAGVGSETTVNAVGTAAAPRASDKSTREPAGFFAGLRDANGDGGDQGIADLEEAARVAGGELYALDDRLSALSGLLGQRPLAASGKGAASVSAAAGEVTWLRSVLKTGEYSDLFRRPGEVRRAGKAVERSVRSAERAVERDMALLGEAGGLQSGRILQVDLFFSTRNLRTKRFSFPQPRYGVCAQSC